MSHVVCLPSIVGLTRELIKLLLFLVETSWGSVSPASGLGMMIIFEAADQLINLVNIRLSDVGHRVFAHHVSRNVTISLARVSSWNASSV